MAIAVDSAPSTVAGGPRPPRIRGAVCLLAVVALALNGCGFGSQYSEEELQQMVDDMTVEASTLSRQTFRPVLRDLDEGVFGPVGFPDGVNFPGEPRLRALCEDLAQLEIDLYQQLSEAGQQDDDAYVYAFALYISSFSGDRVDDIYLGLADEGFVDLPGVDLSSSTPRDHRISTDSVMMDLVAETDGELDGFDLSDFIRSSGEDMKYEVQQCVTAVRNETIFADVNRRLGAGG